MKKLNNGQMSQSWNNKDYNSMIIVRLLSQLGSTLEILKILKEEDDYNIINLLKLKYDRMYSDLHQLNNPNA